MFVSMPTPILTLKPQRNLWMLPVDSPSSSEPKLASRMFGGQGNNRCITLSLK